MCERWARSAAARSHAGTVVASGAGVDQAAGCNACLVPPGERGRHVELQRPDSGVPVVVEELGGEVAVAGRGGPYDAHEHARHGRPQLEPRRAHVRGLPRVGVLGGDALVHEVHEPRLGGGGGRWLCMSWRARGIRRAQHVSRNRRGV